jgi:3-oxoacyl-[acyl-carrier-protein] synthase-3
MRSAIITAIECYLPETVLSNEELAARHPTWSVAKIAEKTGIVERRIAAPHELVSDMAVSAAEKLFATGVCERKDVDFVLLCTQSPDFVLPTTACLVQDRLGLPTSCGATDFNLGCSGFVYGLGLAKGLIEGLDRSNVLLITADTYSKYLDPADHTVRTLFGDAAVVTLVQGAELGAEGAAAIGPFVLGTDGSGARHLMVGGAAKGSHPQAVDGPSSSPAGPHYLRMNGPEIFNFTIREIPTTVTELLAKANVTVDEVDHFVFHQANKFMLDHLRKKIGIPEERFFVGMQDCGNTVSASIPLALKQMLDMGRLKKGDLVALVGFGVGLSWGAVLVRWQ